MLYELLTSMPMFACAFFSAALATSLHRTYNRTRAVLLVWSAVCTLLYGCHYLFFRHALPLLPLADSLYVACNLAVYPLYLIYIVRLTREHMDRRWLAPLPVAAGMGLLIGLLYALMSPAETQAFAAHYLYHHAEALGDSALVRWQTWAHDLCKLLFAAEVFATLIIGTRYIRRYNRLVEERYADTDDKQLHHIGVLLVLFVLTSLLSILFNFIGRQMFADSLWLALPSVLFTLLLTAIGLTGLNQQFDIQDLMRDEANLPDYDGVEKTLPATPEVMPPASDDTTTDAESETEAETEAGTEAGTAIAPTLAARFVEVVDEQQLFLQPDLKLRDVRQRLATNRTYLLNALSQELQMTFSEYINRQRIAYAQQLMEQHPELSRTDVALRCGYTAQSSFYRNWKLYAEAPQET